MSEIINCAKLVAELLAIIIYLVAYLFKESILFANYFSANKNIVIITMIDLIWPRTGVQFSLSQHNTKYSSNIHNNEYLIYISTRQSTNLQYKMP